MRVFVCRETLGTFDAPRIALVSAKDSEEAALLAGDHINGAFTVSEFPTNSVGVMLLNEEEL